MTDLRKLVMELNKLEEDLEQWDYWDYIHSIEIPIDIDDDKLYEGLQIAKHLMELEERIANKDRHLLEWLNYNKNPDWASEKEAKRCSEMIDKINNFINEEEVR